MVDTFILAVKQKFRHALWCEIEFEYALMVFILWIEKEFFDYDEEKIGFYAESDHQIEDSALFVSGK